MGSIVSVIYVNFPLENNTSQMVGLFFEFYFFVMMNVRQGEKGNSGIIVYKKWISVKVKKRIPIYIFWKKMNVRQGERGGRLHFFLPQKNTVFRKFHVRNIEQLTIQNS